ncbi:MAG TPA: UDP-N-acetylmuramoyl-tripeptide--D-alanyl-D-alanine ligase [Bacteroidales bacterium]|nr:UDP-N-acetylmuramoyl-tripeptide--D-alanyl-D-alanine ligase [Bacteroidales bacterium]
MELNDLYNLVRGSAGICTDTRKIRKGEVFFALKGPNHDGNKHAAAALSAGAAAAVTDDPSIKGDKIIGVNDVLVTLTELAVLHRKTVQVPVIAITGTNGKTTTKELVTDVLSRKKKVHSTSGNMNNHIGVPLTLLSAPADAGFLVIEMGANHRGEIASLCKTAMPTHGIITNISKAHIEGFGSFENVIAAKAELYHWLHNNGGIALFNESSSTLKELICQLVLKAVPYSDLCGTDLKIEAAPQDNPYLNVIADFEGHHYAFTTHLFGSYNLDNVRAAMAVGVFFEVPVEDIIDAISLYQPSNNRSQLIKTAKNTLICDSYNANPSSMAKALAAFSETRAEKKMVILGDMLELGHESTSEHAKIIETLDNLEAREIILVGPVFMSLAKDKKTRTFTSSEEAREWLSKASPEGYTILVKGSRGIMLEKIYDVL